MNIHSKGLLIFDLDGTLVNSAPDLAVAVNKTLKDLQRSTFDESLIASWVGNGARVLIDRALSGSSQIDTALDQALSDRALTIFFEHYSLGLSVKTHLYEGVKDTLNSLKKMNFTLAVVTNKPERFIEPILKNLDIHSFFELNVGGDTLTKRKPDPLPLLHVCDTLGFNTHHSIMIGDSKNDILAAKAANMKSIGLTYGYNYGEDIALYKPEWVCDQFTDILESLNLKS